MNTNANGCTCRIQWVDANGNPTPDKSTAIGTVYCKAHLAWMPDGRAVTMEKSASFPICAWHARRLDEPGMENWVFEPFAHRPPVGGQDT